MGYVKYLRNAWKQPRESLGESYRQRLSQWRKEQSIERVEHPTRPDRARSLGYKAKQGFVVARVRMLRGGKSNPQIRKGRRGGNLSSRLVQAKNYQWVAEERAQKRFVNLEVLNSYWVGQDEKYYWYEIIMVDPYHPQILSDKQTNWVVSNKHNHRVFNGKTSAGRRSRGLHNKGTGAEKVRPSLKANKRKLR